MKICGPISISRFSNFWIRVQIINLQKKSKRYKLVRSEPISQFIGFFVPSYLHEFYISCIVVFITTFWLNDYTNSKIRSVFCGPVRQVFSRVYFLSLFSYSPPPCFRLNCTSREFSTKTIFSLYSVWCKEFFETFSLLLS